MGHTEAMRAFAGPDRVAMADPLFARRYGAASSHDESQDGYFVTGLPMSEIFCRPGCSTRTPRPSQVRFYPSAAAAHAAGLTPCPRCRPDDACTTPEHSRGDTLGARALRLIADGEIGRGGADAVATLLGVSARHVLRAVESEAGCGPLRVDRSHRAHLARLLLRETRLPMRLVAAASGFASVRQFNATVAQFYRASPGAMRAWSRPPAAEEAGDPLAVHCTLPARQPFDAAGVFRHLADRAVPALEEVGTSWYARAVRLPHGLGHLRVSSSENGRVFARLSVADPRDLRALHARARRLLDLDADPARVDAVLARDPALAPSVAAYPGMRIPAPIEPAEALLRAALDQGGAGTGGAALHALVRALGEPSPWGRLFPTADRVAEGGQDAVAAHGDAAGFLRVARWLASGRLSLHVGSSAAELADALKSRPGIPSGLADSVALWVLGSPDALPVRHPRILAGARRLGLPDEPDSLDRHAALWAPWRGYAAMHLWRAAAD